MKTLITGASGLVGSALAASLAAEGEAPLALARRGPSAPGALRWDPEAGTIDAQALEGLDAVVHLAGENIGARRWSRARKRRLVESRTRDTRLLAATIAALERPPRVLVSASGVGIYGDRGDEVLSEESVPGKGFLAELARDWEEATAPAERRGVRVVRVRIGLVLAARGGVLARMVPLFRLGLGGRLGHGRQWISWIALDDLVGALRHALTQPGLSGPVNAVAPFPIPNREFTHALARALGRPALLPAPAFALRLALGRERADELLLASQRAQPRRLLASGFAFRFPVLEDALRHVVSGARVNAARA